MSASEKKALFEYLGDPDVRHLYVDSTISQLLALEIKALREAREFDQETLGQLAGGMKQSSISRLQDPSYAKMTLKTLKRLAKAFDVALLVDFVAFSELVDRTIDRTEADFAPPSYDKERQRTVANVQGTSGAAGMGYDMEELDMRNLDAEANNTRYQLGRIEFEAVTTPTLPEREHASAST